MSIIDTKLIYETSSGRRKAPAKLDFNEDGFIS